MTPGPRHGAHAPASPPVPLSIALALLVVAPLAAASEAPVAESALTLRAAIERAMESHPTVGLARAGAAESSAATGERIAERYPHLSAAATGTRYEEPSIVSPIHAFGPGLTPPLSKSVLHASLQADYTLFDGGARGAGIDRARSQEHASTAALDAAVQTLTFRVVRTYLDVLTRAQILRAHDLRRDALRSERMRVLQRLEVGRAADVDRLRIDAALAAADADRTRLEIELDGAERDLARLIGGAQAEASASLLRPVALRDSLVALPESLLAAAMERNPSLARLRFQAKAAAAGASAARGARWPRVRLTGAYNYYADPDGVNAAEWTSALQLTLPLFDGLARERSIDRADASRRAASEQARLGELELRRDVDRALASIRAAHARIESLGRAAARYAEVSRIQKLLLDTGAGTQTDYLSAESDLLAARAALAEAKYDEIAGRADLARVLGALDLDWIDRHVEARP